MRILVTGASGSGTTTLGRALSVEFGCSFLDTDNYYWLQTEPPFQQKLDAVTRLSLIFADLRTVPLTVVAGSVIDWGAELEDSFSLIVFLTLDAAIRVARLRRREIAQLGQADEEFLLWAAQYEEGRLPGRSRARHEAWLSQRSCAILRIDGDLSVAERLAYVTKALSNTAMQPTQ